MPGAGAFERGAKEVAMKRLGIRIEENDKEREDILSPAYPLLAFSYYRSGFIRLAPLKLPRRK